MATFINYFRTFHNEYFDKARYIAVAIFIAMLIALNYFFLIESVYIQGIHNNFFRFAVYFVIQVVAYYGVIFILWILKDQNLTLNRNFMLKSLVGLIILSVDRSIFPLIAQVVLKGVNREPWFYFFRLLNNSYGFFTIFLSMVIVKLFFDRNNQDGLYGLNMRSVKLKTYFIMLLIMVPLIYLTSLFTDFIQYYPTYKRTGGAIFAQYYGISEWVSKIIYETVYIFDFLNTELFFRGFMVIGLSRLLGKNVVLPMVAIYATFHFGKPLGETISSVFGGYILGVIAFYSRSIWGGFFIHGGIALCMEIFAGFNIFN